MLLQLGDQVEIVNGYFSGCKGVVRKVPEPEDTIDYINKWEEACADDGYTGGARTPLVDYIHAELLYDGLLVTFLQPSDIVPCQL